MTISSFHGVWILHFSRITEEEEEEEEEERETFAEERERARRASREEVLFCARQKQLCVVINQNLNWRFHDAYVSFNARVGEY